jgi:hypothetical protein
MAMTKLSRRGFIKKVGASALSLSMAERLPAQVAGLRARPRLPRGYLIVQDLVTYNASQFGAISTAAEAEAAFAKFDVDILICETYPSMAANLEDFVAEYARITRAAGKTFGVMLHRDDKWALKPEEEQRRWAAIGKYQPTVLARYPRQRLLPEDKLYNPEMEKLFAERLAHYRRGGI